LYNSNNYDQFIGDTMNRITTTIRMLNNIYPDFFNFEIIFTSDSSGKTKLNRQHFHDKHELIYPAISEINIHLTESLSNIKDQIQSILKEFDDSDKVDLITFIFDDINFLEILKMNLNSKNINNDIKNKFILDIENLLFLKNKVFNLKYLVSMFDTTILDRYITKLTAEDLIASPVIFDIIDSYALQNDILNEFEFLIDNFDYKDEKIINFNILNPILELHKRRAVHFTYAKVKYKIFVTYDCNLSLNKGIFLNKCFLGNIISSFIEQSYMDLIKKELKRGKFKKEINIEIKKNKKSIQIIVNNNGFDEKNIYKLLLSDTENKYILEAKNLANMINAQIEILPIENEGMKYILSLKAK